MAERIKFERQDKAFTITILPEITASKLRLILVWLILWTLCGAFIFLGFFLPYTREIKLMMAVWFAFWAYFEWKMLNSYRWKKSGYEKIKIENNKLWLSKITKEKEMSDAYNLNDIRDLKSLNPDPKEFRWAMSNSFWSIGENTLEFVYAGKKTGFGLQLSEEEAKKIEKAIKPFLRKMS